MALGMVTLALVHIAGWPCETATETSFCNFDKGLLIPLPPSQGLLLRNQQERVLLAQG